MEVNKLHLRFRFVTPTEHFVHFMDLTKVTKDPNEALMVNMDQVANVRRLHPELRAYKIQEVVKENRTVR
jgi:hypothetical protein